MLPGLTPAHTRKSFHGSRNPESSGARLSIERIAPTADDFIQAEETGLWLLPTHVAERDTQQSIARAEWLADRLEADGNSKIHTLRFRKLSRLLGRSVIGREGCIQAGLRGNQTPAEMVISLAEFEMGTVTHNEIDDIPYISLCGNDDCYNTRHHNLNFGGTNSRMERMELNPFWYKPNDDGTIGTIWGDTLPSVETSLKYLFDFQRLNYPFVNVKDSPLTPSPISQISFHPLTGCWESYQYEKTTSGLANPKNGYGIMYGRKGPDQIHHGTGEIKEGYRRGSVLAHNLIWIASGRGLREDMDRNHLCNYPRCCNPLHLEEISPEDNRLHGQVARKRIREIEREDPSIKRSIIPIADILELYQPVRKAYAQLAADQQ